MTEAVAKVEGAAESVAAAKERRGRQERERVRITPAGEGAASYSPPAAACGTGRPRAEWGRPGLACRAGVSGSG